MPIDEILSEEIEEVADPLQDERDIDVETDDTDEDTPSDESLEVEPIEQPPERDFEHDKAFATMRREAAEAKKQKEEIEKQLNRVRDSAKLLGYNGDNFADELEAQAKGVSVEEVTRLRQIEEQRVKDLIENNPEFRAFKEHARETEQKATFLADLLAIKKQYPQEQASSIEQIANFEKFAELKTKGYETEHAYFIANQDILLNKKVNAAKQNAVKAHQKDHLGTVGGLPGSDDSIEIPSGLLASYKDDFPNDTPKQLKERYNKAIKIQGI